MELEITPRFHVIDPNEKIIKKNEITKRKRHTSKSLHKFKSKSLIIFRNNKSSKSIQIGDNNNIYIFENKFNFNKKFILRNDFDKNHCKKFLREKFLMLEEPILIDEIYI